VPQEVEELTEYVPTGAVEALDWPEKGCVPVVVCDVLGCEPEMVV
jgi:hypothetical protein